MDLRTDTREGIMCLEQIRLYDQFLEYHSRLYSQHNHENLCGFLMAHLTMSGHHNLRLAPKLIMASSDTFADTQKFQPCEFKYYEVANSTSHQIIPIYLSCNKVLTQYRYAAASTLLTPGIKPLFP